MITPPKDLGMLPFNVDLNYKNKRKVFVKHILTLENNLNRKLTNSEYSMCLEFFDIGYDNAQEYLLGTENDKIIISKTKLKALENNVKNEDRGSGYDLDTSMVGLSNNYGERLKRYY